MLTEDRNAIVDYNEQDHQIQVVFQNGDVSYICLNEESLKWVKDQVEKYMKEVLDEFKDCDFDYAIKAYKLKRIKSILKVDRVKARQYKKDVKKLEIAKEEVEKFKLYFDNINIFKDGFDVRHEVLGEMFIKAEPNKLKMFSAKELKKAIIIESAIRGGYGL